MGLGLWIWKWIGEIGGGIMKFNKWKRDDGYILFSSFFFFLSFGLGYHLGVHLSRGVSVGTLEWDLFLYEYMGTNTHRKWI
jgi:hypothetical protein